MSALRVTELRKDYQTSFETVSVLRGISFAMESGENLAITGPSGSGKSTLLHVLGTLDRPTSGTVEIGGEDPFRLSERDLAVFRNRAVGFVFQDHHLLPQYSVLENILLPTLAFPGENGAEGHGRELLKRVGLTHRLRHRPAEISGGERQRAAVARALINRPKLLLCDEPTGNLDTENALSVARLLLELHQADRGTLIVVTHSLDLARMFERRMELREGRCCSAV